MLQPSPPQPQRAADQGQAERKRSVLELLDQSPFRQAWWLPGAHAQTLWSPFFRRRPEIDPRLERWETPDEDFLRLHIIDGEPDKPTALLLHGLEGSARSNYMIGLMDEFGRRGWSVAAMEHRSCGGEMNRARRLYHSGETTDLAFAVGRLIERRPGARIYIAGFSLGGNQTAKWLGQMGAQVPEEVAAASVVSAPYDLTVSGPRMDRVMGGLYTRWFLRTLIPKAIEKEKQFPGSLDLDRLRRSKSFAEFDTYGTAALHGFRDAQDYWASVGCGQFLPAIRTPTLLLSSADDPFNPGPTLPRDLAANHPYLHGQFTERGGHVGFVHGPSPRRSRHWAEEQIVRFFEAYEADALGQSG